jgi:ribonuclease P protein component
MREAHVPTQQPEAEEAPRLPIAYAYPRRSGRAQDPSPAGPYAPLGLIRRVRGRATFAALARAERHSRGTITLRCLREPGSTPPRVAYGVGRTVGGAVARNRGRRRLRAAVAANEARLLPGAAYLVSVGPEALTMPFDTLVDTLAALFEASRHEGWARP